jgi:two-component system response regulator YesN
MTKLIIIDDEPKVRKALRTILLSLDLQIEIAGEAETAFEGLRLIEECEPDLIFLDLVIPEMNGLDMIAHMQKNHHEVQVVIVSGHDDFAYAQQALRYNVVDYILKPFDRTDISRALDKAIRRLHSVAYLNEMESTADQKKREETLNARERIGQKIYRGEKLTENEQAFYPVYPDTEYWSAHLLAVRNYYSDLQVKYSGDQELVSYVTCNFIEEILVSSNVPHIFGSVVKNNRLVFWLLTPWNALSIDKLRDIAEAMKKIVKIDSIILKDESSVPKRDLSDSIHQLERRFLNMDISWFTSAPAIIAIRHESLRPVTDEMLSEISGLLQNIQLFIDHGMPDQALAALKEKFAYWLDKKFMTCQFVFLLYSSLLKNDSLNEYDALMFCLKAQMDAVTLLDVLLDQIKQISRNSHYDQRLTSRKERTIAIRKYIELNYSEALSLTGLARKFYVSKEYLASSFKEEIGITIHQYIQSTRLKKAIELLSEQEYRISDVALRVGYDNYSYFDKLFRKKYGLTPSEYRSKILKMC